MQARVPGALAPVLLALALVLEASEAHSLTVTSLVGDKDGFGIGIPIGDDFPDILAFTPGVGDPAGTDVAVVGSSYTPALPHPSGANARPETLTHVFTLPAGLTISAVSLALAVGDVDDGPLAAIDDRLWVDGVEVAGAFDDVNQLILGAAGGSGLVSFALDPSFFPLLLDGELEVLVDEIDNLTTDPAQAEIFAIDYSEVTITLTPEPGTLALVGLGVLALGLRGAAGRAR